MKKVVLMLVLVTIVILLVACAQPGVTTFDSPIIPPEPGDTALFSGLLMRLVSGGLASVVVYKFLGAPLGERFTGWLFKWVTAIGLGFAQGEIIRYTAIVLSGGVSLAAYCIALVFGFVPDPGSVESWINLVLALLGVGYTGSQVLYARYKPRPKGSS